MCENRFRAEDSRGGTLTGSTRSCTVNDVLKRHVEHIHRLVNTGVDDVLKYILFRPMYILFYFFPRTTGLQVIIVIHSRYYILHTPLLFIAYSTVRIIQ